MKTLLKIHPLKLALMAAVVLLAAFSVVTGMASPAEGLMLANLAAFPVTPELTAVAVGYKNNAMIADQVLPRVPVSAQAFKYMQYPKGEFFTVPETRVGRKGTPNQVEFTGDETDSSTVDHALDDEVPNADIENARAQPGMPDPLMRATMGLTELIVLAREVRAASLVFNAANYNTGFKETLSGTDQWSDFTNSDPQGDIMAALDAMIMRANIAVFGRATWTKLSQHPKLCKAVFGNGTEAGIISRRQFAELFELEDVYVGEGWVNTAKKGQAANLSRVWGKHAALLHRNMNADTNFGITFGFTAQWGGRVAGSEYDGKIGMRGGQRVRSGESVRELVTAGDLGYFFENAVL